MNEAALGRALRLFRARIESLANDTRRCFWDIPQGPGAALFPAVMYCFATVDYFSSHWAGWNKSGAGKNQTVRLTDFMVKYLLYGRKESQVAIQFWRHTLMHTSEPRILRNADNDEVYRWMTGVGLEHHMEFVALGPNNFRLGFDCLVFVEDLRTAIPGPSGYFDDLRNSDGLQGKYEACAQEMDGYRVKLT